MNADRPALAGKIESTLLRPDATRADVEALCREAVSLGVLGVCVPPCHVAAAVKALKGSPLTIVSVAGFPLGFESADAKAASVGAILDAGAGEVDVVINHAWLRSGEYDRTASELRVLRRAAGPAPLKIILETGLHPPEVLAIAARIAVDEGADYLKTSTGMGPRGATPEDVHFLRKIAGEKAGVKASGGIRTLADALSMHGAGADRIGTSSAAAILMAVK